MAATPLAATNRYIAPGVRHYNWTPAIANTAAPTRAEINAGTDLTGQVAAAEGWSASSDFVDVPDFGSRVVVKIPGKVTFADSSFTFYASSNSADVRTLLTRDLAGYVIIMCEGDVPGQKMDVFKVTVSAVQKLQSDSDAAQIMVQFAIMQVPNENVTVPA